jgi:hypothetical protein
MSGIGIVQWQFLRLNKQFRLLLGMPRVFLSETARYSLPSFNLGDLSINVSL